MCILVFFFPFLTFYIFLVCFYYCFSFTYKYCIYSTIIWSMAKCPNNSREFTLLCYIVWKWHIRIYNYKSKIKKLHKPTNKLGSKKLMFNLFFVEYFALVQWCCGWRQHFYIFYFTWIFIQYIKKGDKTTTSLKTV